MVGVKCTNLFLMHLDILNRISSVADINCANYYVLIITCHLDDDDLSDESEHDDSVVDPPSLELSGVSGVSKTSLIKKVQGELNISGEGELRRPEKRYDMDL